MITTPGDVLTPHGQYCKESLIGQAATFDDRMYDWNLEKIKDFIDKNSENDIMYIKYSYKELGRSEAWFRDQCRSLNNDQSKINREILLQWNRSTDLSPFAPEDIDRLRSYSGNVLSSLEVIENYFLHIYETFDWNSKLLIGADFGGSTTKDSTAISIVDPITLHVLADFKNNKADPITIADILYALMSKYFPNSVFVPEQNAYSEVAISLLLKTDVANRIYYEYKDRIVEQKMENGVIKKEKIKTKVYGVQTNAKTRPLMMDIVFDIVNEGYKDVISPEVIEDIAGLERHKNKIEHSDHTHDDSLFSYLMVRYVYAYGVNLARFKIYKPINSKVEDKSNLGNRSDEEFVRNFSNVLQANFSNRKIENQTNMQESIINEFLELQKRQKDLEDEKKILNNNSVKTDRFASIFALNRKL